MKRAFEISLYVVAWVVVAAYIIYAASVARQHRVAQKVEAVKIAIVDSSASAKLVTRPMVEKWIKESKVQTIGRPIDSLELLKLESYIKLNGFVDEVKCYTTYKGELHLEISQLQPVLRVLLDGYNLYITADGYTFQSPPLSSRYVQVLTGSYKPLFLAGYSGNIEEVYNAKLEEAEAEIKRIEVKSLYPLYASRLENRAELKEVNSNYIRKSIFESRRKFEVEVVKVKAENAANRERLQRELREIDAKIAAEKHRQNLYRNEQKKLKKRYEDFINLITFVQRIEEDKFWNSEIVQLVATESSNGELLLEFVPRSGTHKIIFGRLEWVDEKLDNIKRFYEEVLSRQGWGSIKSINVEYRNQIVCK